MYPSCDDRTLFIFTFYYIPTTNSSQIFIFFIFYLIYYPFFLFIQSESIEKEEEEAEEKN